MERTEAQWQQLYKNYVKKYDQLNEKILRDTDGANGMYHKKYSYLGYINAYSGLETIREEQVSQGKRKVLNVQRDLINEQKYKYSEKQARAIKKGMVEKKIKELDMSNISSDAEFRKIKRQIAKEFKVREIRQRPNIADDYIERIKDRYRELKSQKYRYYDASGNLIETDLWTTKQMSQIIAEEFYGSEPKFA